MWDELDKGLNLGSCFNDICPQPNIIRQPMNILTSLRGDYLGSTNINENKDVHEQNKNIQLEDRQSPKDNNILSLTPTNKNPNTAYTDLIKVLNKRLALGEITIEEYYNIKEILTSSSNLTSLD